MSREPTLHSFTELPEPSGALIADLRRVVGIEAISVSPQDRVEAGRDMWPKGFLWRRKGLMPTPPEAVLYPRDTEEVSRLLRFASERAISVVPVGARSGVLGALVPMRPGTLALDTRRLAHVYPPDRDRYEATVGAGVIGLDFERMLRSEGFTLGHAPASLGGSTIGGWIATRSAGQHSSRYGKIEDMVVEAECVLGTGEVVHPARPTPGTDWLEIFAGSEGTLAVVTQATFRLWPAPDVSIFGARRFPDLAHGVGALREILQAGYRPSVLRLYDPFDSFLSLRSTGEVQDGRPPAMRDLVPREPRPVPLRLLWNLALQKPWVLNRLVGLRRSVLLVLVHEGEEWEARAEARAVGAICDRHEGEDLGEEPAARWMQHRWEVSRSFPTVFELGGWVDTLELAIGWSGVVRLYEAIRKAVSPHAFCMAHLSHAYPDGCSLYFTFLGAAEDVDRGLRQYDAAWEAALRAARREGATISHHHGVGLQKAAGLAEEVGERGLEVLRALDRTCDPVGILNPGKWET